MERVDELADNLIFVGLGPQRDRTPPAPPPLPLARLTCELTLYKKKDKCIQWFKNNSKGGFVAPFFFWKNAVIKGGFMSEDTGGFFHCQNKYSESLS